jgi:hypothetical protein
MPALGNNGPAYEKGRIKARRRGRVWSTEAFCANGFWGWVLERARAWNEMGEEIQPPKPNPVWSQALMVPPGWMSFLTIRGRFN